MSKHIDRFCEDFRVKLTGIEKNMQMLKAKIDSNVQTAEQDVRKNLEALKKRVEQDRTKVTTAQADIKKWVEGLKAASSEKIAQWKAKNEVAELRSRAEIAESYAAAAAAVALAAIDDAEQAALEAWLARKDADTAKATKAA